MEENKEKDLKINLEKIEEIKFKKDENDVINSNFQK